MKSLQIKILLCFIFNVEFIFCVNGQDTILKNSKDTNPNKIKISNKFINYNTSFSDYAGNSQSVFFSNLTLGCNLSGSGLQFQTSVLSTGYVDQSNHYEGKYYFSFSFDKNYFIEKQRERLIQKYINENNIPPGINDLTKEYESKRAIINQPQFQKQRDSISRINQSIKDSLSADLPIDTAYAEKVHKHLDFINSQLDQYTTSLENLKKVKTINKDQLAPADTIENYFNSLKADQLSEYSKKYKTLIGVENFFNSINTLEIGRFQVNNQYPIVSNISLVGLNLDANVKKYYFAITAGKRSELNYPYSFSFNPITNANGKVLIAKTGLGRSEETHIHVGFAADEYQPRYTYGQNDEHLKSRLLFTDIKLSVLKDLDLSFKISKMLGNEGNSEGGIIKKQTSYFIETRYFLSPLKCRLNFSYLFAGSNYINTLNPYIYPGTRQFRTTVSFQPTKKISIQLHSEFNSKVENAINSSMLPSSSSYGATASYFYKRGSYGITTNLMYVNYDQQGISTSIRNNYSSYGAFLQHNFKMKRNVSSTLLSFNLINNSFRYGEFSKRTPGYNVNASNNTPLNKKFSIETRINGNYKSEYDGALYLASNFSYKINQKFNVSPGLQYTIDQSGNKYLEENLRVTGSITKNISMYFQGNTGSSYVPGSASLYRNRFWTNFSLSMNI